MTLGPVTQTCAWFARCDHLATGVVEHPALGLVPTCRRCAQLVGLDHVPATFIGTCDGDHHAGVYENPTGDRLGTVAVTA